MTGRKSRARALGQECLAGGDSEGAGGDSEQGEGLGTSRPQGILEEVVVQNKTIDLPPGALGFPPRAVSRERGI